MTQANILPVNNIINVTIEDTPSGLINKSVNSVAIMTQDVPLNLEVFGNYVSAAQVASNYGTNSTTSQMANNLFAQIPNPLSGEGGLTIIPMTAAVSATAGHFNTANLSANLAGIIAITNGSLGVSVDSVAQHLTGLNFTNCVTWSDVAGVLQNSLIDCIVVSGANGFVINSNKVGSTSSVAMNAGVGGTDMNGASYFNGAAGAATAGANSSGETILQCLSRTQNLVKYTGIMSTLNLEDAVIEATASGIQAQDYMYFQHAGSTQDIAGIATTVMNAGQKKTRILTYTQGQVLANLYKAAYVGRLLSVDFTGSNTSSTMNLKQLANVVPDPGITQTLYVAANIAGTDVYVSYAGVPSVFSTQGNDFADNPYSDLALKFALETAGFNYLRQTNTKVPQTEPGMDGLKDAYRQVCQQFVTNGCVAPGQWNSSETFGDPTIFNNNILAKGFYIYSQPIALQNSTDRDARKAPLVQIAIKRAGAIHTSNVIVLVNS